ncbi:hypothetical protein TYRP_009587 [Tyrophagus putrescentiae]|nr:hypothetical protein TYRP_009587 [Tyrophagus putrescentiae]
MARRFQLPPLQHFFQASSANHRFHRLARRISKIKAVMLVTALLLALLAFAGLLLLLTTTAVVSGRLTEDQAAAEKGLFWLTTTELKRPFQHRLTEQLRNEGGVGIKPKLGGGAQCLAVAYSGGSPPPEGKEGGGRAAEPTPLAPPASTASPANRTLHLLDGGLVRDCLYCGPPAAGCRPRVEWCKAAGAVTFGEVSPGVAAVDVHQGALYFALYSLKLPFQCAGIDSDGFLVMEPCTGRDRQLFYLDQQQQQQQYQSELEQLMGTVRSQNLLLNNA